MKWMDQPHGPYERRGSRTVDWWPVASVCGPLSDSQSLLGCTRPQALMAALPSGRIPPTDRLFDGLRGFRRGKWVGLLRGPKSVANPCGSSHRLSLTALGQTGMLLVPEAGSGLWWLCSHRPIPRWAVPVQRPEQGARRVTRIGARRQMDTPLGAGRALVMADQGPLIQDGRHNANVKEAAPTSMDQRSPSPEGGVCRLLHCQ